LSDEFVFTRPGCNVLFNDGSVRFVTTEKLGRLKWRIVASELCDQDRE